MKKIISFSSLFILLSLSLFPSNLFAFSNTPEPVFKNIGYQKTEFGRNLVSEVEYRAVMNADYESVVSILANPEGVSNLFKNIVESPVINYDPLNIQRKITAAYEILGITVSYSYLEKMAILKQTDDSFEVESVLFESLDKKINAYRGFWRVEKIPGDSERSLVSLYSYYNYRKPFFMQDVILETFTDSEITDMFCAVEKAANEK